MNGELLRQVKELFEAIVIPHLDNLKEDVLELTKKFDKVQEALTKQALKVQSNTIRLDSNDRGFNKSILIASIIIGIVSIGANLLVAYIKK